MPTLSEERQNDPHSKASTYPAPGVPVLLRRDTFPVRARRRIRAALDIPRRARHSFRWDATTGVLTGLYMGMTFPFFVKIARGELHTSEAAISLMIAAPFIGNLFSPLWARRMEGQDKLPFCFGSWIIARAFFLFMPLAWTGQVFVGLVSALQVVGTVSSPAYASLMRDIYPDETRGRLMGYVRAGMQTAMFLATLITGRLLDGGVPYRYLFPVAGALGICAALAFRHIRPLHRPVALAAPIATLAGSGGYAQFLRETLGILRHNVPYRWFALSVFVYGAANLMVQPLYGLYQVDALHISSTQIANLANFSSLWSIFGAFFWGRFMDRRGAPETVLYSIVCVAFMPLIYILAGSAAWLLPAAALSGLGFAGIELAYLASILKYAEPHRTAQYQSLHSLLLGVRGVLAPLIGVPLMKGFGYPTVFIGALLVMIAGAFLQSLAVRAGRTMPERG